MDKNTDPTMGGLDALVAAASSVAGQAGKNRAAAGRGVPMNMIDPSLQNTSDANDVTDAMSLFLSNPAVVQLVAEYNAKNMMRQHRHVSLYTQLLSGSTIPSTAPETPTQTRSGRISRPPVYPPPNPLQHFLPNGSNPPPIPQPAIGETHIQAIKDALENVSATNEDPATYDALMQAVGGDASGNSRFWRNTDLVNPPWPNLEAPTLAQAAEASHRSLGNGLPLQMMITDQSAQTYDSGKRTASLMNDTEDESVDGSGNKRTRTDEGGESLPEWPLPPTGKGGRKNMSREELLARRRARNRVAAQESRKKKKEFFGNIADRLTDRESAFEQLQAQCQHLEQEVESLKRVILGAGLELPASVPNLPLQNQAPPTPGPSSAVAAPYDTPNSFEATPNSDLPFHDLFTIDDNDADDGDFVPPSSPKRDSESDDSDDDDDIAPSVSLPKSRKGKKRAGRGGDGNEIDQNEADNENENESEETPIAIAEDVEEDLFLPIEDVPVPPRDEEDQEIVMKRAMTELHVDTPQELMGVIKKMVETAGYGGVTEEQVGMLSKLLALGQAQGMSVW